MQGEERGVTVASLALREAFSSVYVLAVCFSPLLEGEIRYDEGDSKFSLIKKKDFHIERNLQRTCVEKGRGTKQRLNRKHKK